MRDDVSKKNSQQELTAEQLETVAGGADLESAGEDLKTAVVSPTRSSSPGSILDVGIGNSIGLVKV